MIYFGVVAIILFAFAGSGRRQRTVSPAAWLTIIAVAAGGTFAAVNASPLFGYTTVAVIGLLFRAASRAGTPAVASPESSAEFGELPPAARDAMRRAMSELVSGDARRLLLSVVVQARPIFAARATQFDPKAEEATRQNASALVQACCDTALELGSLDAAGAGASVPSSDVRDRMQSTRAQLVGRLSRAASALGELYLAGHEHGSPASNRVLELVDEIGADARARGAALSELQTLLERRANV